jgi:amino acid transporter
MIAINQGAGAGTKLGTSVYPETVIVRDLAATDSWAQAFLMSLSIAAFAFVGVETTAAFALEARVTEERNPSNSRTIGKTVKFSAVYISFLAGVMYVLAGVLVTLNIKWDDPRLPRMSWVTGPLEDGTGSTASAFVLVAEASKVPGLAGTLNVFLMFTALSCANTNLYVASRSLFSLTRSLDGGPRQPWYTRLLAYFGKTNNRKVPLRALIASCIFAWIPFLYLASAHGPDTSIGTILDVLSEMGSIGVIIVWACECWAYIRFHDWYVLTSMISFIANPALVSTETEMRCETSR